MSAQRKGRSRCRITIHRCFWYIIATVVVLLWYELKTSLTLEGGRNTTVRLEAPVEMSAMMNPNLKPHAALNQSLSSKQSLEVDEHASLPWALFYNIFIPKDQGITGLKRARRIVKEQIDFVRRSSTISKKGNKTVTLFYNTIGDSTALDEATVQNFCTGEDAATAKRGSSHNSRPPIRCRRLNHFNSAFEEVTLQSLYDFCQEHPTFRVSYIHSKGSYHDHEDRRNEYWRRHGTLAAVYRKCVHPPERRCNVCGLQFWAQWTPFFPGNFWTSECSYVKNLLPPLEFGPAMENVTKKALLLRSKGVFQTNLYSGRDDHFGVGRFSSEHWIGSHPKLIPCDLSEHGDFGSWIQKDHGSKQFSFGLAPRHKGSPVREEAHTVDRVEGNRTLRIQEYFLLGGRLFKYYQLYGEAPPPESWVWRFFPDGNRWKKAVKNFGERAIELVIRGELGIRKTPLIKIDVTTKTPNVISSSSPPWSIFYHLDVTDTLSIRALETQIREHLHLISASYAASLMEKQLTVFYNSVGDIELLKRIKIDDFCSKAGNIKCIHMQHFEEADESVTYTDLQQFCQENPSLRVVSMGTSGGYEDPVYEIELRSAAIEAVTSEHCLRPPDDTCNLCGSGFYTQWAPMMKSNIWAAHCGYINKLVSPGPKFEGLMEKIGEEILLMKLYGHVSTELYPGLGEHLGLESHAAKQWVGSHPDLTPCVVSEMESTKELAWSPAPTRHAAPRDWSKENADDTLNYDQGRVREYFFLGGRFFKWLSLYNATPRDDNWVFDWFPDASGWRAAGRAGISAVRSALVDPATLLERDYKRFGSIRGKPFNFTPSDSPGWATFYNVYFPSDQKGQNRAIQIIEDQLQLLNNSYAATQTGPKLSVFISTIGTRKASQFKRFLGFCARRTNLQCVHLGHSPSGHEDYTLQRLYDFCSASGHEDLRVAYIHSKGSFHPSAANDRWRQHSTMAVTSEQCLNPPDSTCNLCGLQFYPVWNIFYPGNFWTAKCSYIQRLISPREFPTRLEAMSETLRFYQKEGRLFAYNLYDHGLPWRNGVDRFAWEIWSATHPSLIPCDLSPTPDHSYWRENDEKSYDMLVWSMAPRQVGLDHPWFLLEQGRKERVMQRRELRMRDYFLLPGNIAKWIELYGAVPEDDSWVWRWFPDGEAWREGVHRFGLRVFERMTDELIGKTRSFSYRMENFDFY